MNPPPIPPGAAPRGIDTLFGSGTVAGAWRACFDSGYDVGWTVGATQAALIVALAFMLLILVVMAVAVLIHLLRPHDATTAPAIYRPVPSDSSLVTGAGSTGRDRGG